MTPRAPSPAWAGRLSRPAQWLALLALSAVVAAPLLWLGVPAALLLGPMLAAIVVNTQGGRVAMPGWAFTLAQGALGCLIAAALPTDLSGPFARQWPLYLGGVLAVIAVCGAMGWGLTRWGVLPGSVPVWGLSPGAATAMVVLAESNGADPQLVAFMQYFRVVLISLSASTVAHLFGAPGSVAIGGLAAFDPAVWIGAADLRVVGHTLLIAVPGAVLAHWWRLPSGALLLPLLAGIAVTQWGGWTLDLPPLARALVYAVIGWRIGSRFTRDLLLHAWRALPAVAACTILLIVVCGGLALILVAFAGIDPLSAFLATSPGGADTISIIATTSGADAPFVLTMQTCRFLIVLFVGPALARFIAARAGVVSGR